MEKATLGAGCFWGVEAAFQNLKGIISTTVGYMGGSLKNPTYEDVCTNTTGHAEVVHIVYDESVISYQALLDIFWSIHDPTQLNRQGPDRGSQYRSVIFYHSVEQKRLAEASKKNLSDTNKYRKEIVTEICKAEMFYPAEQYHQKYLQRHNHSS